jgi:hypothetical protein
MNCKNCKHFTYGHFEHYLPDASKIVKSGNEKTGMCLHPKINSDYVESWTGRDHAEDIMDGLYADCDENRGHLHVGPDFGCIHFEIK